MPAGLSSIGKLSTKVSIEQSASILATISALAQDSTGVLQHMWKALLREGESLCAWDRQIVFLTPNPNINQGEQKKERGTRARI
mmetsp:Transcript_6519/g.10693  ORF Transcript_6519/g.10693 Transcript_6519/m.10693 type:complete len:84 (-) Transcript_6519:118-369(-)